MKSSLKKQAERFLREQKNYKRWLAVFLCLAVVVTIGTTAALKYKGIAVTSDDSATEAMHMEQTEGNTEEIPEGMRRHVHTEVCYAEQPVLICEAAKAEAGETADAGAADAGTSNAGAAEEPKPADTAQGHTHSDSCYEVTGGTEKLTCAKEEHTHGDGCYETKVVTETVTKTVPETVNEEVTDEDGNVTTVSKTVDKTVEETVEKEEEVLTCAKEEHSHGASCYTVEGGERALVCGKEEGEGAEAPAAEEAVPAVVNADAAAVPAAETAAPAATEAATENAPATEAASTADAEAGAVTESTDTADAAEETTGEHVHDDSCYELQMVLICGKEEGELEAIEPLSDEMNLVQTAETENYSVTVTYSESAMIPEEAVLQVVEYAKDSEQYIARCAELGYQPDFLLNIGFFVDGSEVEPQKTVNVKIIDKNVDNADGYEIVHFAKDGMEEVTNDAAKTGEGMEMEFSTDSFTDWSGFALQSETSGNQVAEVAPVGELAHEKTVEPVKDADGNVLYYDLTLNVKGAIADSGEKSKLDIVFVVDRSGSMAWAEEGRYASGTSRRELANDAIIRLVDDLDAESGIDAQYKLVTFSDTANTYYAGSWRSGATLKGELPTRASGGTNYEDGLEKAGSAIGDHREDSKTIVIFLTDGAPTYYNSNGRYGNLGGDGSTTTVATVEGAERGAGNITCDYFFAVGFGSEMTKDTPVSYSGKTAAEILQAVADATNARTKDASTTTNLTDYFAKFIESLKSIRATGVTFTDKLTPEVSIVDETGAIVENPGSGNWTPVIKDENGNVVPLPREEDSEEAKANNENTLAGMNVTYDANNGLSVSFKQDYVLRKDYTYSVTTKIMPNEKAAEKLENNGYIYPDKGDKDTGSESSDQQGIFCNEEAEVSYSYKIGNTPIKHTPDLKYPFPVVQLPEDKTTPPPIVEQDMTHDKYIKKVVGTDDVYDLTLDLTGRVGSTMKPAYYNVLFVVDTSGSMDDNRRLTNAKSSMEELVKAIEDNEKIIAKYSLVSFGSSASVSYDWGEAGTKTESRWGTNRTLLYRAINNLSADGGTNYQAALTTAKSQLSKNSGVLNGAPEGSKAESIVIFLTDGVPTYHGTNTRGGGNYTEEADYKGAINAAKQLSCSQFYAIGYELSDVNYTSWWGDRYYNYQNKYPRVILNDVTKEVAANTKETYFSGNATELKGIFEKIQGTLVELRCHDVTVTDTLSDYVEVNTVNVNGVDKPATLKIEIKELDSEGKPSTVIASETGNVATGVSVKAPATTKNPENTDRTITARYDTATKQIVLDFPTNYKLESGYKYYVTVQVRASEEAYRQAENLPTDANGSPIYPNTGGAGTDHQDNDPKISEGQKGFFTNKSAEVTFVYDDSTGTGTDPETEIYERPVIKVNLAKLTVKKTVSGLDVEKTTNLLKNMSFILNGDESNPVKADMSKITVQDSRETPVEYLIVTDKEVVPGTYIIAEKGGAANVEGYVRETSYIVNEGTPETPPVNDDNTDIVSSQITLEANGSATVEFINNYTARTETIALKKVDQNGKSKGDNDDSEGFFTDLEFLIRYGEVTVEDNMSEEALDTAARELSPVATLKIDKDGDAVLEAVAGKYTSNTIGEKEFKLPVGTYTVIEDRTEKPLVNYNKVYPFTLTVTPNGQVEVESLIGFSNKSNVKIDQPATKKSPWKITVVNEQMKMDELRILKVSSDSNEIKGLSGAKFDLYKAVTAENGTEIDYKKSEKLNENTPLATDENGVIKGYDFLKNLEAGNTYYLKEVEAPAGFELQENAIVFTVSVVRDKYLGDQIQITGADGSSAYVVRVDGAGKYVKYDSQNDDYQFSVDESGKYWTLAVVNNTGAELPVTGGPGTIAYTFGGLAMIIAVSLMYGLSMRRKREKGGLN